MQPRDNLKDLLNWFFNYHLIYLYNDCVGLLLNQSHLIYFVHIMYNFTLLTLVKLLNLYKDTQLFSVGYLEPGVPGSTTGAAVMVD